MALFRPDLLPRVKPAAGLRPVTQPSFGGLNLAADPQEVGWQGAIDVLNVELNDPGRIRTRDGYDNVTASTGADRYANLFVWDTGGAQVIIAERPDSAVESFNTDGTVNDTTSLSFQDHLSFAAFGSPTNKYVYAVGWGTPGFKRYDGTTWTTPAGTPSAGGFLAVQPNDNRLVHAAGNSAGAKVSFSNVGDPATWGANDFVRLTPGDGEVITGMVAWQNYVFVFKETKFFVFTGNSTDQAGDTDFVYRAVQGRGCAYSIGAIATGPDGVYFLAKDGIYRTTGSTAQKISSAIDPLFGVGTLSSHFAGGTTVRMDGSGYPRMIWHDGRLLFTYTQTGETSNSRILVYDIDRGTWSLWDIPATDLAVYNGDVIFSYATGANHIGRIAASYTTDDGAAITSRYRTGFYDLGTPGSVKTIRAVELDGYGTPTVKVAVSDGSLDTGQTVRLGVKPATTQGTRRFAFTGRNFSVQIGGTTAWSASRLTGLLRSERPAGLS